MNIETVCNTPDDVLFSHIRVNSRRQVPWLKSVPAHDGHAVLVGGGPSVSDWLEELHYREEAGQTFFCLNGSAEYLYAKGFRPEYQVIVDAREHNKKFLKFPWARKQLLASQCHPGMFEAATDPVLWHSEYPDNMQEFEACLPDEQPECALIGGGTTVGLSAVVIAYALGFRKLHLYGYDSSYRDDHSHAYAQSDPQRMDCISTVAGRSFKTSLAMARQAELFPQLSDSLLDLGCFITIRGDGLLPWTSRMSAVPVAADTALPLS
jgi:hypothetical protein